MTKIYTKTGDQGMTSLFAGGRVSKADARLHAYGTIDELNSILGVALAHRPHSDVAVPLTRIQGDLFVMGADLATPLDAESKHIVRVDGALTKELETEIDHFQDELPELKNFILPGGTLAAATMHHARTVCRRAERWVVEMEDDAVNAEVLIYLNRLSDWLFVAARVDNARANVAEPVWTSQS